MVCLIMAKFNNKFKKVKDADDIRAIICFQNFEMVEFQSDLIEPWEIPKSTSVNAGIRNDCDWHFYCGATGIKSSGCSSNGESTGQTDYLMGLRYWKLINKVKL